MNKKKKKHNTKAHLALDQLLGHSAVHLLVHHHNHDPLVVLAPPPRPPRHLDILPGCQPPEVLAVELAHVREEHRSAGCFWNIYFF